MQLGAQRRGRRGHVREGRRALSSMRRMARSQSFSKVLNISKSIYLLKASIASVHAFLRGDTRRSSSGTARSWGHPRRRVVAPALAVHWHRRGTRSGRPCCPSTWSRSAGAMPAAWMQHDRAQRDHIESCAPIKAAALLAMCKLTAATAPCDIATRASLPPSVSCSERGWPCV